MSDPSPNPTTTSTAASTDVPAPTLPIIDISPFLPTSPPSVTTLARKRATASALSTACRTHGFFYLTSHNIPPALCSRVLSTTRTFFLSAPASTKASISRRDPGSGGDGARGYQALRTNATLGRRDWHEAIDFYRPVAEPEPFDPDAPEKGWKLLHGVNLWPPGDAPGGEMETVLGEYFDEVRRLGECVMRAMAWALGYEGPGEDGEEVLLRSTRRGFWVARAIGYPPLGKEAEKEEGVSCGEHTDYGCTTFLLTDSTPGALQVRSPDNSTWLPADPLPGCYVVNIGDMMERWTNGLWRSTRHRVVHRSSNTYRVSVPFFYEPDWDARVRPLDKCLQECGGEVRFGETIYGDHLVEKVSGNFYRGD